MTRRSPWVLRAAALLLALVALIGVFADVLASEAPLVARHRGTWLVLPAVTAPAAWARVDRAELSAAVWAPLSADPNLETNPATPARALAATIHGARSIVVTTVGVLLIALGLGVPLGALAGRLSFADSLLARAVELSGALPALVLLAALGAGHLGPSWLSLVLVLGVLRGVEVARLVRGEVLRVSGTDFVLAARALGGSPIGVTFRHVLPHVWGPVTVSAAFTASAVVTLEAALSFLGLGLPHSAPSWGRQLALVARSGGLGAGLGPAIAVVITAGCAYLVADALDDRLSARRAGPSRV